MWPDRKQRKGERVYFGSWFEGRTHHGREDVVEGMAHSYSDGSLLISESVRKQRERCLSVFLHYSPWDGTTSFQVDRSGNFPNDTPRAVSPRWTQIQLSWQWQWTITICSRPKWTSCSCLSTSKQVDQWYHFHKMEFYSAIQKNILLIYSKMDTVKQIWPINKPDKNHACLYNST